MRRFLDLPLVPGLVLGSLLTAAPAFSQAALTVQLSDGTSTYTCVDGGSCDLSASDGNVTLNGLAIGGFSVIATIGVSKPIIGSQVEPSLQLSNLSISGPGSGTLDIQVSDDGFSGPIGPASYLYSLAGTVTSGTVSAALYTDASNALFGRASLLDQFSAFGAPSFNGSHSIDLSSPAALYSLTMRASITSGGSSFNVTGTSLQLSPAPVPLPTGALLFGSGLLGLIGAQRRVR